MEKYRWTPDEIDKMDFYNTLELVFNEMEQREKQQQAPTGYIDQVLGI